MLGLDSLAATSLALNGLLFLWAVFLTVRVRRLGTKHRTIKALSKKGDLAEAVDELYRIARDASRKTTRLEQAHARLEENLKGAIQGIGVVRFDAFDDAAGRLSFAVALLDAEGNGVVVSTINGRHESRSYAKPIERGASPYELSDEEIEAVNLALK